MGHLNRAVGACAHSWKGSSYCLGSTARSAGNWFLPKDHRHLVTLKRRKLQALRGHTWYVYSLAMCGNDQLVSGSWDRTIRIWCYNTWSTNRVLQSNSDLVWCFLSFFIYLFIAPTWRNRSAHALTKHSESCSQNKTVIIWTQWKWTNLHVI